MDTLNDCFGHLGLFYYNGEMSFINSLRIESKILKSPFLMGSHENIVVDIKAKNLMVLRKPV